MLSWPCCAGSLVGYEAWQCCGQGNKVADSENADEDVEVIATNLGQPSPSGRRSLSGYQPGDLETIVKGEERFIIAQNPKRPAIAEFLQALKDGGGVVNSPGADKNEKFLDLLDKHLPELRIYSTGKIQTSPSVEEIEGSATEYYRTVGALVALLSCYAVSNGDSEFGLDAVSKGARGPMSLDQVPGKFINMGSKPDQYTEFCKTFAMGMDSEEDWWAMFVFLAVHDVGKSDAFRNAVNSTLPVAKRSDDHDRALAVCLSDRELKEKYLPSVVRLSPKRQEMLAAGFNTNFQLPQLGQGEIAVINLRGLLALPKDQLQDGTLRNYLYHSIFDIAGTSSNEKFIYPLALVPVYMGFSTAMKDLIERLQATTKPDEKAVYFDFLYTNFKKAYPELEEKVFAPLCESKIFREEVGLVVLRILALTRNTYKNAKAVIDLCNSTTFANLVQEMAGNPSPPGPQVMLYYAPDMLRMGLGEDLTDESGANMKEALLGMDSLYRAARTELAGIPPGDLQYQLNVQPVVTGIKTEGKAWTGGKQLRETCAVMKIQSNEMKTEGILAFPEFWI